MNAKQILGLLPANWQRFLTAELPDFNSCGVEGAERLLLNAEDSFHGNQSSSSSSSSSSPARHPPDWYSLVGSLMKTYDTTTKDDPGTSSSNEMCSSDHSIIFFQLPVHLQRTFLGIISHHAAEISLPLLQKLTRHLQDSKMADHWSRFHLHTIQNHIATHFPNGDGQSSKVIPATESFRSQRSNQLFDKLCQSIIANNNKGNSDENEINCNFKESNVFDGIKCFIDGFKDKQIQHEQSGDIPSTSGNIPPRSELMAASTSFDPHPHKRESDLLFDQTDLTRKRSRTDNDEPSSLFPEGDVLVQPPPSLDVQELDEIGNEAQCAEGVGKDDVSDNNGRHHLEQEREVDKDERKTENLQKSAENNSEQSTVDQMSFIDGLEADKKVELDQLKACWHGEGMTAQSDQYSGVMRLLTSCSPAQLTEICAYIDLSSIPTPSLPTVCQSIVPVATLFSYTAAVFLAEKIFLQQITSLDQNAPRVLNTALSDFTRTFPKAAIEGVLTPSLVAQESSAIQFDLVSKVTRDALGNVHKAQLLKHVLIHPNFVWSEPSTSFVQSLIDAKLELDSSLLGLLATSLDQNATSQAKCKKFAKLLLALINKYGKQMTPDHMTHLWRSVEVNQTFLKKACQTALKKLSS